MLNLKTVLLLFVILATCYCQQHQIKYIKRKKHHGLRHIKFLHYLIFLAIKLKLVVFFGTIFTVGLIAAKIFGIIKATEYLKHKYHVREEKIVYVDPHEHHHHEDVGGYSGGFSGGYSGGFSSPGDYAGSKIYPSSYSSGSDISFDHPPGDTERFGTILDQSQFDNSKISGRNSEASYSFDIYNTFAQIAKKIRRLNITEKAFDEMGIQDETCKKKIVCLADFNAEHYSFLQTGFSIIRDDSYQKYRPSINITSDEDCSSLYKECQD